MHLGQDRQKGLTLIELMIALALGSILILGVIQLFSSMKLTYSANEGLSRLQERGRFAMEFLAEPLRMSGHMGCHNHEAEPHGSDEIMEGFFDVPLTAHNYNGTGDEGSFHIASLYPEADGSASHWTPALEDGMESHVLPGSDVFGVSFMDGDGAVGTQPSYGKGEGSPPTFKTKGNSFKQGQVLVVSDCAGVSVVGKRQNASGNEQVTFGSGQFPHLSSPAEMAVPRSYLFYIGRGAGGTPSLFRKSYDEDPEELIEGVEVMQLRYGVDTDNSGAVNVYRTAAEVEAAGQWEQVIAVRLALLVRSDRETRQDTWEGPIDLMDTAVTWDADRIQRRLFTTTVRLRNR